MSNFFSKMLRGEKGLSTKELFETIPGLNERVENREIPEIHDGASLPNSSGLFSGKYETPKPEGRKDSRDEEDKD